MIFLFAANWANKVQSAISWRCGADTPLANDTTWEPTTAAWFFKASKSMPGPPSKSAPRDSAGSSIFERYWRAESGVTAVMWVFLQGGVVVVQA
ncbi:hypothetical protein D9M71_498800 [compost metagenome]